MASSPQTARLKSSRTVVNNLPMHARLSVNSGLESRPAVVLVQGLA